MTLDDAEANISVYKNSSIVQTGTWLLMVATIHDATL